MTYSNISKEALGGKFTCTKTDYFLRFLLTRMMTLYSIRDNHLIEHRSLNVLHRFLRGKQPMSGKCINFPCPLFLYLLSSLTQSASSVNQIIEYDDIPASDIPDEVHTCDLSGPRSLLNNHCQSGVLVAVLEEFFLEGFGSCDSSCVWGHHAGFLQFDFSVGSEVGKGEDFGLEVIPLDILGDKSLYLQRMKIHRYDSIHSDTLQNSRNIRGSNRRPRSTPSILTK